MVGDQTACQTINDELLSFSLPDKCFYQFSIKRHTLIDEKIKIEPPMYHDTKINGHFVIVTFRGEIDLEHSPTARDVLLEGLKKGRTMIVDMSGVNVIDSSGVASLLEAFQLARKKGMDFYIAAVTPPVFRVFRLARLETVFEIVDSVDQGMEKSQS